jgi:hypothetical protein
MERSSNHDKKWNSDRPRQVFQLALLGANEEQICAVMGITPSTLNAWKDKYPEFLDKMYEGRMAADAKVVEAFYQRCIGYEYTEEVVHIVQGEPVVTLLKKKALPDTWAAMKWLGIRQKGLWSDVQRTESIHTNININKIDLTGLSTQELMLLEKLGRKQISEHATEN